LQILKWKLFQTADKKKLLEHKDFLDEEVVPQKMVNVIIDTIQCYVISYLQDNRSYVSSSKGFEKILKEILLRKFPVGVTHTHLLANVNDTHYFPWEGIFDLQGRL